MSNLDLLVTALKGMRTNIARSLLTMLGIIIGVGSIVLVMSLGEGAQSLIICQVQGIGGDTIFVRPGREPKGPTDFANAILTDSVKISDVRALEKKGNAPNIVDVVPAVIVPGSVSYKDAVYRPTIFGWEAQALTSVLKIEPSEGAYFGEEEIRSVAKVAVIGSKVREELFGSSEALGQTVHIKNTALRVVGVLPKSGQLSFFNPDELVVVPYTTAQQYLSGIDYFHELMIKIDDPAHVDRAVEDINHTMREQHNITDPSKDDFYVETQQDILARISVITQVLTLFLSSIAAISLVVGGVGIMNIMLVSVTERTREIGLRKALGATNKDIRQQFLFEALLLTIVGGIIGTTISITISWLVSVVARSHFALDWPFAFPFQAIILGIGMAALVGLTFGLYPASKAAHKDPIEALRYE